MPIIANTNQQVISAGMQPRAQYSRIVSLTLMVAQADGVVYAVTGPLGNAMWLLDVQLWSMRKDEDVSQVTGVNVFTGTSAPKGFADVTAWENVLPLQDMNNVPTWWYFYGSMVYKSWVMGRLFTGAGRRFGIVAHRVGEVADVMWASFRISEG